MEYQFLLLVGLLIFSGFFSGSEIAFIVSNKIKLEIKARKNKLTAKEAIYFVNNPQILYSTILISNNIINVAFASIFTVVVGTAFQLSDFSILIYSTILLLIFGELLPKYFAFEMSDTVVLASSIPIRIVSVIIYPFVKITSSLSALLIKSGNVKEEKISLLFQREDLQVLLDESSQASGNPDDTYDIVNKIIDLGEQKIYEVITPRTEIVAIDIESNMEEVLNIFIESGFSKIPVYEDNIDNIKGVIYAYDMFKNPGDLNSIIREVLYVPDTKKTLEMLNELLAKRVSIAVVIDEFGGTAGIITTEDIIEEMLGEIMDEHDIEEEIMRKIDNNTYILSGKVEVDLINEEFELKIPDGDYETIAGYITSNLGTIPTKGETFNIDHFKFYIIRSDKNKIDLVKLVVIQELFEDL
ncbi:MAG: hemolysin family protein [Bacteroidetes bacterium]|nr:hemolysin family protein [Bacteroidota bacterium]